MSKVMGAAPWRSLLVASKFREAEDIVSIELIDPEGRQLAPFSAGSHIDIEVPSGVVRQYSLCNSPRERRRYVIGVLRTPASRGGSSHLHDAVRAGDRLNVANPRNRFELAADADRHLLLAGGIGITPLLAMAERLHHVGAAYEFHYATRSRRRAAFLMRSGELGARHYFDDDPDAGLLDLERLLSGAQPRAHLYVCGPAGFIGSAISAARRHGWTEERLHREYFTAEGPPGGSEIGIVPT